MDARPNRLERALARAADDEPYRADFYRVLMESDVFVYGSVRGDPTRRAAREGDYVAIGAGLDARGSRVVPFFSSLAALRRGLAGGSGNYVRLSARALFHLVGADRLVLNPGLEYAKEFVPGEGRRLLAWAADGAEIASVTVERQTQVLVGRAREVPRRAARTLATLLAEIPEVRAAYLAQCIHPGSPGEPRLVMGIDAGDAYREVVGRLRAHAVALSKLPQAIDLVPMDGRGMSSYLAASGPFYTRGWAARLRAMLPLRRG